VGEGKSRLESRYKDFYVEVHKIYDIFFGDLVNILGAISFLAVLISCLGLLAWQHMPQKTRIKEISIRKVLGCSDGALIIIVERIVVILLIAIVIAVPTAYFLNNLWLEQLAYHVSVDILTIVLGVIYFDLQWTHNWFANMRAVFVSPVENLKGDRFSSAIKFG